MSFPGIAAGKRRPSPVDFYLYLSRLNQQNFMSRLHNSLSKFVRPPTELGGVSSFVPSQLLSRNISLRYTRTCVRPGPLLVVPTACVPLRSGDGNVRHYANGPGRGMPLGGFSLGQQQQKGDALKEYVRGFL